MTLKYGATRNVSGKVAVLSEADRDRLAADQPGFGTSSKMEAAFNLVNSTVGAGIIGLPFAIYLAGFWRAIILSTFVAILTGFGCYILIISGQRVGIYKYAVLMEYTLGRFGYHFLNFLILVQSSGACVSYFILIGDTIPVLLNLYFPQHENLTNRSFIISLIAIFFVFPLNLSRSLGSISKWSIISVLCLPVILIALLIRAPVYSSSHEAPLNWQGPDMFGALGILAFAFACSQVCFGVFLSLEDQTDRAWSISNFLAFFISWFVSIAFAVIGYLSFGKDVQPNLFLNFPNDDILVNVGRFALGFSMILTVPMAFYPTREAVQKLLGFETATRQPNSMQHYSVTVVLFIVITVLGITVRSLGKLYALVGGFAATFLAYILPAMACLVTRRYSVTAPVKQIIDEATVKTPLIHNSSSSSSEDSASDNSIINSEGIPKFGLLDVSAVILLIWGVVVMIFATGGVLFNP